MCQCLTYTSGQGVENIPAIGFNPETMHLKSNAADPGKHPKPLARRRSRMILWSVRRLGLVHDQPQEIIKDSYWVSLCWSRLHWAVPLAVSKIRWLGSALAVGQAGPFPP